MSAFTPGPLHAASITVRGPNEFYVGQSDSSLLPEAQKRANATLWAASPQLYEALERLVVKYGKNDDGTERDWTEYVDAREALKKARGE